MFKEVTIAGVCECVRDVCIVTTNHAYGYK